MKVLSKRTALILVGAMTAAWALSPLNVAIAQEAPAAEERPPTKSANDPGYILEDQPGRYAKGGNQCIFFRRLHDWEPLNDTNLIVWAPSRNFPYHIQLAQHCRGLRFTISLGFFSRDSNLCPFGGDAVLVDRGGGVPERCSIARITKLTDEAVESLRKQAPGRDRRKARDEKDAENSGENGETKDDSDT